MAAVETATVTPHCEQETPRAADLFEDLSLEIPPDALTYDGFLRWATSDEFPERGRIDYLGGRLFIDMASEEINSHVKLKQAVHSALDRFAREKDFGELLADGTLFANQESDSGSEPDGMLCTFESLESGRVRYVERTPGSGRQMSVQGSPDLVVEVVSNSSVRKDTRDLRDRYFAAGVREYWILDARGPRLTFELLAGGGAGWAESVADPEGFRDSAVLGARVMIERGATRVGTVRYDVSIRQ